MIKIFLKIVICYSKTTKNYKNCLSFLKLQFCNLLIVFFGGLGNFSAPNTFGTNCQMGNFSAWELSFDPLQIGQKASFCLVVSMADIIADLWVFAANCTFFSHDSLLL